MTTTSGKTPILTMAETFVWELADIRYPGVPAHWAGRITGEERYHPSDEEAGPEPGTKEAAALREPGVTGVRVIRFRDATAAMSRAYLHAAGYTYHVWSCPDSPNSLHLSPTTNF